VYDSHETLDALYDKQFDILILDVNLPDNSGFELLKELREADISTPAIFTTSLNSIDDLEMGYNVGCDDYLKKPFELRELLYRIQALIKRELNTHQDIIQLSSNITFDIKNNLLKDNDDKTINLKNKESQLLKLLLQNKNQLVRFETIFDRVWSYEEEASDMSLRTYIKNLRNIIGKDKIISIKRQGYKLEL
jgi:DNA-binding response OmpR family regulator